MLLLVDMYKGCAAAAGLQNNPGKSAFSNDANGKCSPPRLPAAAAATRHGLP